MAAVAQLAVPVTAAAIGRPEKARPYKTLIAKKQGYESSFMISGLSNFLEAGVQRLRPF